MTSFYGEFVSMSERDQKELVEETIQNIVYELENEAEVASVMADMNAGDFDFEIVDVEIVEVDREDQKVTAKVSWSGSGTWDVNEERPFSGGDTLSGTATVIIDKDGKFHIESTTAEDATEYEEAA